MHIPEGLEDLVKCAIEFAAVKPVGMRGDSSNFGVFFRGCRERECVSFYRCSGATNLFEVSAVGRNGKIERLSMLLGPNDADRLRAFLNSVKVHNGL